MLRRGLRDVLSADPRLTVVGEAATATEALTRIPATRPDVAVLDVRLPDGTGVEVCREVRSRLPETGCLMLTSYSDDEALSNAILAGASGYVLKDLSGTRLCAAIHDVAAGRPLLDPTTTARLLSRLHDEAASASSEDSPLAALSQQERRILDLIGEGLTNRQIGRQLHLAEKTVKNYVSSLFAKLGMERRTQAAAYVARMHADEKHRDP